MCTVLVLGAFLCTHYYTLPWGLTVVSHERVIIAGSRVIKADNSSNLIKDYLSQGDVLVSNYTTKSDVPLFTSKVLTSQPVPNVARATPTDPLTCEKKFDVSFLKVHKAGSTTIMNIFLRFAIEHDLNIVLPSKSEGYGFNYLGYGNTLYKDRIVPLPENETYNILCNHVVYNKEAFRSILPNDTEYVGILREPASHFVSAASYYGFYKSLLRAVSADGITSPVTRYLQNPTQYTLGTGYVKNRMSFDFGIPKDKFTDEQYLNEYIKELDTDYGLVMVMERFHESLVLLKRLLCWSTKDILYVPLNARKAGPDFRLSESDKILLKNYNNADFKLYDHFKAKFDANVESLGEDFQNEVVSFVKTQDMVAKFCLQVMDLQDNGGPTMQISGTKWSAAFSVTVHDCKLMTESELPMMKRLIETAWYKYNRSLPVKPS